MQRRRKTSKKQRKTSCPKGKIMVDSYVNKRGVTVTNYCKKDVGAPGKTPISRQTLSRNINSKGSLSTLPEPGDEFSLVDMGYSVKRSERDRQNVLKRAGKKYGILKVQRHLLLRANLQQWNKKVYNTMKSDVDFLSDEYKKWKDRNDKIYGRSKKRRSKRKSSKK